MVVIRLRRAGSNQKPFFRVVVADSRSPIKGKFLETVGWYDPKKKGINFELKTERIEDWVSKGAQMSDTVRSLMKKNRQNAANPKPSKTDAPEVPAEPVAPAEPEAETEAPAEAAAEVEAPVATES